MLGLIMKDILVSRKYLRSICLLIIFYIIFGALTNNMYFGAYMIVFLSPMLIISVFSFDEMARWDSYALSLPVKRIELVLSRYILAFTGIAICTLLSQIVNYIYSIISNHPFVLEDIITTLVIFEVSIIVISITTPFIYKYGIERGRIALFVILGLPSILLFILAKNMNFSTPSESTIKLAVALSPVVTILLAGISLYASVLIYNKKEV